MKTQAKKNDVSVIFDKNKLRAKNRGIICSKRNDEFYYSKLTKEAKTDYLIECIKAEFRGEGSSKPNLEKSIEWENELDMLGTNASNDKYLALLEKAPIYSPSKKQLTDLVQARMSA